MMHFGRENLRREILWATLSIKRNIDNSVESESLGTKLFFMMTSDVNTSAALL